MSKEMLFLCDVLTDWCKKTNYHIDVQVTYFMVMTLREYLLVIKFTG